MSEVVRAPRRDRGGTHRRKPLMERFERYVERIPFHTCWEWTGPTRIGGYGRISSGGKNALGGRGLIEAQVAMSNGELPSIDLEVEGKKYQLRQDSRNDFDDPVNLAIDLHERGVPWSAILRAVGYFRVTDLQRAVGELEEDKREDAYGVLADHRTKKSSGYALVNTDSPYRKRRAA